MSMNQERLGLLMDAIQADVDRQEYDGAVVLVAREGQLALHEAIGFADRARERRMRKDDVFNVFSVAKSLTAVAVLMRVEQGRLALTMPAADLIPEFRRKGKQRVTVAQLLCHMAGLSAAVPQIPLELFGNLAATVGAICEEELVGSPGEDVLYSSTSGFTILGEIVRRTDPTQRSFKQIIEQDLLVPLGMQDTSIGLRPDLAPRRVPAIFCDRTEGLFPPSMVEVADSCVADGHEHPSGFGTFSTARDFFRWAEMLRMGGALEGKRLLSEAAVRLATSNQTGMRSNQLWDFARQTRGWPDFPAFLGLGFFLRGNGVFPTPFGTLASPRAFGCVGLGSTLFWVDPERALTCVCFTSGLLEESRNIERFQRLSDIVHAAAS